MMVRVLMAGLLLCAVAPAVALQDSAERADVAEEATALVEFAGFAAPELGDGIELRGVEHSNGTIYGLDLYRVAPEDAHRFSDGTPLIRFSQTIGPLGEVGTVEQLQEAILDDARNMYERLELNESIGEDRECTRVIFGEERTGRCFDAVLSHDVEMDPEPVAGWVETYAFEHAGRGIGVMLRVAESNEAAAADDLAHLASILGGAEHTPVTALTPYTSSMGGYPVRLPVGSRVASVKQPNENTITGEVVLEGARLSVFIVGVPQQYSPRDVFVQLERTYEQRIAASIEQSGGQASLKWSGRSPLPAGPNREDAINAAVYMLDAPGGEMYSALYKNRDGRIVMSGVFNTQPINAGKLHEYAQIFVDGFRGNVYGASVEDATVHFDGWRTIVPQKYNAGVRRDDTGAIECLAVSVGGAFSGEGVFESAVDRRAFTLLRSMPEGMSLREAHRGLARSLKELGVEPEGELRDPIELSRALRDGREVRWLASAINVTPAGADGASGDTVALRLSSGVVRVDGRALLVSAVSPTVMAEDAMAMAAQAIGRIDADGDPGTVEMNFGVLEFDPERVLVRTERIDDEGGVETRFDVGPDRVRVFTLDADSRMRVMSSGLLAAKHMADRWGMITWGQERDLFPASAEGLEDVTVAGHDGLKLIAHLPGQDEDAGRRRRETARLGLFGFRHNNHYTIIEIIQTADFDDARFDEVLAMFEPEG